LVGAAIAVEASAKTPRSATAKANPAFFQTERTVADGAAGILIISLAFEGLEVERKAFPDRLRGLGPIRRGGESYRRFDTDVEGS
jgi:hypothetical protein